ncbi:MAG: hypothetical protein OXI59_19395, partial [Gemmatimonadota bacterium]|nr:hypothetical protein [Gemmatimonadota bacterium]
MPNEDTLLAYLVSSFPGNTENIATEALRHIFDRSDAAMDALNDVVHSGCREVSPITAVKSQVVQIGGAQPDLVGYDDDGNQRVLIEVKFWAALTAHQPNSYIKSLPDEGPAMVVFLVPDVRIQWLWPELIERMEREFNQITENVSERRCVRMGGTQKYLMIASWSGLLDSLAARTQDYGEPGIENEIRQLRTLAKYADEGAFKPVRRNEKLGADSEKRLRDLERMIDAATDRGIEQGWLDRKGLNRTPRSYGYGRYIRLGEAIVWFGVNTELYESTGSTPIWLDFWTAERMPNAVHDVSV